MKNENKIFSSQKRQIYLISFLICILVFAGGYYYYRYEEKLIRYEQYEKLQATDFYLYPLIQSVPVFSKTFETLLIRKDGDRTLLVSSESKVAFIMGY